MKTILVDFDGVIHSYHKKWHDGTIYGTVLPGTREALQHLLNSGCEVVIFSTRAFGKHVDGKYQPDQYEQMKGWLIKNEVPFTRIHQGEGKPLGLCLIDDSAIRFETWSQALADLQRFGYLTAG